MSLLGKQLEGAIPLGAQPVMQMVTPMNDVQLVALIAGTLSGYHDPAGAVTLAMELVAESIIQMDGFKELLAAKTREKLRDAQET